MRGHEAYAYVENIRKYRSLYRGYLEKKEAAEAQPAGTSYPVAPDELNHPAVSILPFVAFSAADAFEKVAQQTRTFWCKPAAADSFPAQWFIPGCPVNPSVNQQRPSFHPARQTAYRFRLCTIAQEHITHGKG